MKTLAENLKAARKAAGLKQAEVAAACGWDPPSRYANYEQGIREPTLADLRAIAKAVEAGGHSFARIVTGIDMVPSQSQRQRPDFEILSGTVTLLRAYLLESRQPSEFIEDPIMLETAYEVVMEFGQPVTSANVIDLTKILEDKVRRAINGQDQVRGTGKKAGGKKR